MSAPTLSDKRATLTALPSDEIRGVMWRFADRDELQRLVQATRRVARGPVARLVVEGAGIRRSGVRAKPSCCRSWIRPA